MKYSMRRIVASLAVVVSGALGVAAPGVAAAEVGQVCNVHIAMTAGVFAEPERVNLRYWMGGGSGFRIVAYGANNTYYGHASGVVTNGYLWREYINQSSCHW